MLVFAHRGASAIAPENTLLAISAAVQHNADGIEFDVYQHGNEFILIHDCWLHRTTDGRGNIYDFTLAELQAFNAGQGEKIPTLAQVLTRISGACQINIEMKGVQDAQAILSYVNQVVTEQHIPANNIIYSSFDHHLLKEIKSLQPDARIGALTANKPLTYAKFAEDLQAEYMNADVTFVDQAFVEDAHARGLKIGVYTVDQAQDLARLKSWGVDMVFSNHPANAKRIIKNLK
ncbi:glycerophosphodiester phosphodiesterase family protein [Aliiglaciecola sp. M165]|uniref:glycerophosphodiester phosphodiesterase n=1 Tax=Aliiglaciecola sp. M165 TaxID=2593649 RepID=UPI0011801FEC|nr:glycerophosphodiester phosphodiesterase family protein [Aliiglaciecola sp. M165]TRY31813.1 glycerophosphodiester phosphodiesterase [Aliiglaciecola sp. M165]